MSQWQNTYRLANPVFAPGMTVREEAFATLQ